MITEILIKNLIKASASPYSAPIIFSKKNNGKYGLCIDYRALDKNIVVNLYPLPHIDELFSKL